MLKHLSNGFPVFDLCGGSKGEEGSPFLPSLCAKGLRGTLNPSAGPLFYVMFVLVCMMDVFFFFFLSGLVSM